ncbi:MAG: hypothetical protein LBB94_05360 [Clostridiales bacterium]|nr:hypothetical protein [Clostridiales bacterium]
MSNSDVYEAARAIPDKVLAADGSIITLSEALSGEYSAAPNAVNQKVYEAARAIPDKFLASNGTIFSMAEILLSEEGSGEAVTEHNALNGRDLPDAHPVNAISGLDAALSAINADLASLNAGNLLINGPEMHRIIFRGSNLGSSLTAAQKSSIQDGTFKGLWLGDYWAIGGINWRIVDFDYWYNCGASPFTKHHLVIMPDTILYNAQMNTSNTTAGGYVGSAMYTANLANAKTVINSAFSGAVLSHDDLLVNAVANGYSAGSAWYASSVELPNELMMYGSPIYTPMPTGSATPLNYTTNKTQLALFQAVPKYIAIRATYWLRDVVSVSGFTSMDILGHVFARYSPLG